MKHLSVIFIVLCMLLCLIPSVGMVFFPTTQTAENRAMAAPAELILEDGSLNTGFSKDFKAWFDQHIALRNQLVCADGLIQTKVFATSNVASVLCGTDGWLYYSSTMDDYLGTRVLSQRQLFNLANNFAVVQAYLSQRDIAFALTVAPNKNSLYSENMPYYSGIIQNTDRNARLLAPLLQEQGVNYVDLFALLEGQTETLYLRRDSHWNNKGAYLAYTAIMQELGLQPKTYASPTTVNTENGDLNKMVYSFYGPLEQNYDYGLPTYDGEKGWLVTESDTAGGKLLMFRDSFANTLIPFMSQDFATACYSKGEPNALERYVETYEPDCLVIQKVERNIANYLDEPPILTPTQVELPLEYTVTATAATVQVTESPNDPDYWRITGTVDTSRLQTDSHIYVSVDGCVYRAYQTGENGFLLYLKKTAVPAAAQVRVYTDGDSGWLRLLTADLDFN